MDWVSFEEIKKTVTLAMVIDRYGIRLRKGGPEVLRGRCPLPSHSSTESTESFIATLHKGTGGVWSCHSQSCAAARGGRHGGNVLDLVAAIEKCSVRDAAIKLQTWFLVPAAGHAHASDGKEPAAELVSKETTIVEETEANKPLTFSLKNIDHTHLYLKERGVADDIAKSFGVGVFTGKGSMRGRCVIPIHNARGELLAYAGRSIDGSEPKYKFPGGFRKSLELYNLNRISEGECSVVLVEGFFDCIRVSQAGYQCVALMGCSMSKTQEKLFASRFANVVVMLDGDDAGRSATESIIDRLQQNVFSVKDVELRDGVQPDQLTIEEIKTVLSPIV